MKFGSLFAGIGGFDLGLERAGMECKWQVEIDDFCNRVLEKHWPHVKRYRDVREVGKHNLEPVDLICGGFPCQPFSVAGKQRGKEDDRHLWPEMFRIVSELRPAWVVGENVPGLVRLGLDEVLSDLEGIGYSTQTFDIPACAVDAPHVRHRIWIVAHTSGRENEQRERGIVEGQERSGGRIHTATDACGEDVGCAEGACPVGNAGKQPAHPHPKNDNGEALSVGKSGEDVADADRTGCGEQCGAESIQSELPAAECGSRWLPEPELGRVAHGIPRRVDRLRSLGNAVVPQVVEIIGRAIMECERINRQEEVKA